MLNEISSLRYDLQLNGYPHGFVDSVINSKSNSRPNKEAKPSHMGRVFQRSSNVQGLDEALGRSSKLNTLLGVLS
jgi:hypothetical protein